MAVQVTVRKAFLDLKEHVDRKPGDVFEATEARAAYIANALPGYVTYDATDGHETKTDYGSLKVAELRRLCEERGVDVPKRAKKADLVALLEG